MRGLNTGEFVFETLQVVRFVNLSAPDCTISEIPLNLGL